MLFALSASVMVIPSCNNKEVDNNGTGKNGTFTRMNIENVKTLFIASSGSGSKMYGFKNSSLKSTTDEEIYEIGYFDENGEPVEKNNPDFVYDVGDFVYVFFAGLDGSEAYFVQKSDGLAYSVPLEYCPPMRSNNYEQTNRLFRSFGMIQLDKNKNIYFPAQMNAILYRVSSVVASEIQFTEVSAANDHPTGFCVDDEGQVIYAYRPDNAGLESVRCRKPDGSFVNMVTDDYDTGRIICFWKGTDGRLYGIMQTPADAESDVCFVKIQEGQIAKIRNVNHDILVYSGNDNFSVKNVFRVQGRIIYCVAAQPDFYPYPWHLIDISDESSYKETLCQIRPNMVINNQLCYFDDKTFSCTLINIDNGETSLLYDLDESKLNNYNIDKIISVTESGVVFSALSDGKYIVAKIGLDNSVTVQQTIEGKVSVIMPLEL